MRYIDKQSALDLLNLSQTYRMTRLQKHVIINSCVKLSYTWNSSCDQTYTKRIANGCSGISLTDQQWCHKELCIWVNIDWGKALFSGRTKPLSEPMQICCQFDFVEQMFNEFESKYKHFHWRKCLSIYRLQHVDYLCVYVTDKVEGFYDTFHCKFGNLL